MRMHANMGMQSQAISDVLGVLQQLTSPKTEMVAHQSALKQLEGVCTNYHRVNDHVKKSECQICIDVFSMDMESLTEFKKGNPSQKNRLSKKFDSSGARRVTLSCGHDQFHHSCIVLYKQVAGINNCPVCKAYVTNWDEL